MKPPEHKKSRREEGAVMIVTMLIVMMVTATGAYAMLNTSYELRGSGHVRASTQAQYVAESSLYGTMEWLDRVGPTNLMSVISQSTVLRGTPMDFIRMFGEPQLVQGQIAHRMSNGDFQLSTLPGMAAPGSNMSILGRESVGPAHGPGLLPMTDHFPLVIVDLTDIRRVTRAIPGARADGGVGLSQLSMTVTARGRLRRPQDVSDPSNVLFAPYEHADYARYLMDETASDSRAYIVSVPFLQ